MLTPLGQRQVLTTAAMEAVRAAHEGAVQAQQVQARRQAFTDRMAEGQHEVPLVEGSDGLRLDPDRERGGQGGGPPENSEEEGGAPESGGEGEAGSAGGRLDLLA